MILTELYNRTPEAYQDIRNDNSQPQLGDLRKSKLTLSMLRKLRKLNDLKMSEYSEKLKHIRQQYAPPAQPMI